MTVPPRQHETGEREYTSIASHWPHRDSVLSAFRYLLAAPLLRGLRVLEVGCGSGEGALLAAPAAARYACLDHHPWWTELGIPAPPNVSFIEADASALETLRLDPLDAVVAFELIEHLDSPSSFLASSLRLLKPSGFLLLSTPNFDLLSKRFDSSRRPLVPPQLHP